jgi:hypothetical protein
MVPIRDQVVVVDGISVIGNNTGKAYMSIVRVRWYDMFVYAIIFVHTTTNLQLIVPRKKEKIGDKNDINYVCYKSTAQ